MRRADRLFRLIQYLRGRRRATTARDIAEALEVSVRTIYRDIADLAASGVPIDGEAGVGYVLRGGFDLPPLMFDEQEIEALLLGARIVQSWTDTSLAEAAADVVAKVEAVIPERLRRHMAETALLAPENHWQEPIEIDLLALREALRSKRKLHLHYRDGEGRETRRQVRPLGLAFYGPVWILAAWCELRDGFRAFRLDRMAELDILEDRFRDEPGKTLHDYLKQNLQ